MEKFTKLTAVAAPLPIVNCDTDKIIPARFLKTLTRTGLGKNLFDPLRYDPKTGEEIPISARRITECFFCTSWWRAIIIRSGSSREHAAWAVYDHGTMVISTSFADIFYNNCFKNGILPVVVTEDELQLLMKDAEKGSKQEI